MGRVEAMDLRVVNAMQCPKCGGSDCTEISDVDLTDMPDACEQGWYCARCEMTYRVVYAPYKSEHVPPVSN